jgi:hypothetical protein
MRDIPCAVTRDLERFMRDEDRHQQWLDAVYAKIDALALEWTQVCYGQDGLWAWEITAEEPGDIDSGTHANEDQARLNMSVAYSRALRRHAEAAIDFPDEE